MSKDQTTAPPSFDYDVFISYSSKDEAWVHDELLKRIEHVGLKAFIDFRDFTPGVPINEGIARGVTRCRKTLLVLTPEYVKSEWCELESNMSLSLSPANRDRRRIPLLKVPCDKPLHVVTLTHIDFTDSADQDVAWRQLFTGLGSAPESPPVAQPTRDEWFLAHPYAMPPNFRGRLAERAMLTDWLTNDAAHPLLVLRALGGFGKSALTWHWLLSDVDPVQWPRVVWWSFYETDATFESFVTRTLSYLNYGLGDVGLIAPRNQLDALLRALHSQRTLLILDGFERALRAFGGLDAAYRGDEVVSSQAGDRDCASPLADGFLRNLLGSPGNQGKVLLTTRLRPASSETRGGILLQGCREVELVQLQPADALSFFQAQGIRGGRAEIEAACAPYGYHPLSLRILAGWIVNDLQQPGDIAAAQRLDVSGDLIQRQHHVLDQAYASLGSTRQKLFSCIACFRSPVSYDALQALEKTEGTEANSLSVGRDEHGHGSSRDVDLRDLVARGLLHHDPRTNKFDLHPIVRRYAYDRLAAPDRADAHARLRDYFAAQPAPEKARSLDDLGPVIELYHHTVSAGQYEEGCDLFHERLYEPTYYQLGEYEVAIDLLRGLFRSGEDKLPRLDDKGDQAWVLNALANAYSLSGQPRRAMGAFEAAVDILKELDDLRGLATATGNLGYMTQIPIGELRAAETNLRRRNSHYRSLRGESKEAEFREAVGRKELASLLAYRGAWVKSDWELKTALKVFEKLKQTQSECVTWTYLAHLELLKQRSEFARRGVKVELADLKTGVGPAKRALEKADETARTRYPVARDYIRAHWLLGAAYRVTSHLDGAEKHLHEALEHCRRINLVEHESDILIDIARLRMATSAPDEARRLAVEALIITERCGYVLQGADAHIVLAQHAKDQGDVEGLREHANEALRLATCGGPPDYTYKAAYDEATALLRG